MIAFVRGEIEHISEDNVIIDVGGIGYNVKISAQTADRLPGTGREVKLYTYTCVREDAFWLYGFLSREELEIFKKLITVNGIGPKGGLAILSVMTADDLRFAIMSGDAKAISRAPGIGLKTAGRVILDLKDKISLEDAFIRKETDGYGEVPTADDNTPRSEAVEALVALGYSASDALRAVKQVDIQETDVEIILKQALKYIF